LVDGSDLDFGIGLPLLPSEQPPPPHDAMTNAGLVPLSQLRCEDDDDALWPRDTDDLQMMGMQQTLAVGDHLRSPTAALRRLGHQGGMLEELGLVPLGPLHEGNGGGAL